MKKGIWIIVIIVAVIIIVIVISKSKAKAATTPPGGTVVAIPSDPASKVFSDIASIFKINL